MKFIRSRPRTPPRAIPAVRNSRRNCFLVIYSEPFSIILCCAFEAQFVTFHKKKYLPQSKFFEVLSPLFGKSLTKSMKILQTCYWISILDWIQFFSFFRFLLVCFPELKINFQTNETHILSADIFVRTKQQLVSPRHTETYCIPLISLALIVLHV